MAEPTQVDKQDSLEDSLSSDEWTIIYKKESKVNNLTEGKTNKKEKTSNESKETAISEEARCSEQNIKSETEHVEEGEEAGEKDNESDVSVISDESEPEQIAVREGRIERIEWQVERRDSAQNALVSKTPGDGNITSNTLITCSVIALIVGIILAGRIVEFQGNEKNNIVNTIIEEKLRELAGIEEKLKELNDVKQALDQIQINMPEIKKLKDQLMYQTNELRYPVEVERPNKKIEEKLKELTGIEEKLKELNEVKEALNEIRVSMSEMKEFGKTKYKETNNDHKPFEKLNIQNILHSSADSRLEMLEVTYQNFCLTINSINASSPLIKNELCKTPKILSEMILFKENLRRAFEQSQNSASTEKRIFTDLDRKLDEVSESLLSELSPMFSRFSMKMQERLNRFGYKLKKRLCSLHYTGITDDKFLNILLDDKFFVNNCNDTSNSNHVAVDTKYNSTYNEEKHHSKSKRSYEELKKNGFKYDYKNMKNYKKLDDSREEFSHEKKLDEDNNNIKSKGEIKNDNNWKKNKYENKEKLYQEEKKYEKYKHEKFDNNYKNEFNKKNKQENDNFYESGRKEFSNDRKFENGKRERNYDRKYEHKKDHDRKYTYNKDEMYAESYEDKRNSDYDDESKYIINLEYDAGQYAKHDEEKQRYKNDKDYVLNSENYKESKYKKYENKKDKYQANGEWQMQRFAPQGEDRRGAAETEGEVKPILVAP